MPVRALPYAINSAIELYFSGAFASSICPAMLLLLFFYSFYIKSFDQIGMGIKYSNNDELEHFYGAILDLGRYLLRMA